VTNDERRFGICTPLFDGIVFCTLGYIQFTELYHDIHVESECVNTCTVRLVDGEVPGCQLVGEGSLGPL
jgi:hypothetical protein